METGLEEAFLYYGQNLYYEISIIRGLTTFLM